MYVPENPFLKKQHHDENSRGKGGRDKNELKKEKGAGTEKGSKKERKGVVGGSH